jgi:protein-S-isoprenylcysteine O-methyltransferase Ste14
MNLVNTELAVDVAKYGDKQIYVTSYNGEKNILMEADTAEEARQWSNAIEMHIKFADSDASISTTKERRSSVGPSTSSAPPVVPNRPASMAVPASTPAPTPAPAPVSSSSATSASTAATKPSPATTSASAAAAPTAPVASAPAVTFSDSPDIMQFGENLLDFATKIAADNNFRNEFGANVQSKLTSAGMAAMENLYEGDAGSRGEQILGLALLLFIMIIFGIFPRLLSLIMFFVKIAATLMIAVGLALSFSALMDLGDNMSLFLIPNAKNHKLVSTGAYALVRHPIYGGIIMFTFGWSILKDNSFQLLLSVLLAMVLVS